MKLTALLVRVDGTTEILDMPEDIDFLDKLYDVIGCMYVDHFTAIKGEVDGWVDDDGMNSKQPNLVATSLLGAIGYPANIYGNVVLTGGTDPEGWTKPLLQATALQVWAQRIAKKLNLPGGEEL